MRRSFLARAALAGIVLLPATLQSGVPSVQAAPAAAVAATPSPAKAGQPTSPPASPVVGDPAPEVLPLATQVKGPRPKANASVLAPADTRLLPGLERLASPPSLALPNRPEQVRIQELRPLSLADVDNLAQINNPNLKAVALQVDEAQASLRAQIALWYPTLSLSASSLPTYTSGQQYNNGSFQQNTTTNRWALATALTAQWALINPQRVPQVAAARDTFEKAKNQYLIGLRDLRLQASQAYFDLQFADDSVRIGQESVRASIVSLKDARARFQAGVATKLEVLQAETQLARDQQLLTEGLAQQAVARRTLAALLDLPQNITPTAKEPARVLGTWIPSLQDSIIASYTFREELDQAILDISIANSQANAALGSVQPFLNIVNTLSAGRYSGSAQAAVDNPGTNGWNVDNAIGLNLSWRLFDGGAASAQARQQKLLAQENRFRFAGRRDAIRQEVEESFYTLLKNDRNISTTSREVVTSREALRLTRLRFQAGVTTQREVVDSQRDLTQAEVRYAQAVTNYNKSLAQIRRRTGLDQIALCKAPALPAVKPSEFESVNVPVEPTPLSPACAAPSIGRSQAGR
ncbi:MAG: TolC family protein [Cyanobacteriota bacterium]